MSNNPTYIDSKVLLKSQSNNRSDIEWNQTLNMLSLILKNNLIKLLIYSIFLIFSVFHNFSAINAYADVIIDNGGSGTSSTGVWDTSSGTSPYGGDSLWSRDGSTYTWSFSSQPAGVYRVHMWWSAWSSRASSIDVTINNIGGPTTVVINQQLNAGQWNSLGEYSFGTSGSVTITAANGSTLSTCADAVWFEYVSDGTNTTTYIDNDEPGTSYSGGAWGYSSGADPYGGSSRAESLNGATYTFQSGVTGSQEVSLWWTWWSSRCSAVPVDIYDGTTLLDTVQVDQQQQSLAGQWNVLGSYSFSSTARVVLRAQSGCSTDADAVRFIQTSTNTPPTAYIDSISPSPANLGESVTFSGHGTDDGSIIGYSWESDLDGSLSSEASFSTSSLSEGVHTISFKVEDNDGVWSQPVTEVLTVGSPSSPVIIDNDGAGTSYSGGSWGYSSGVDYYGSQSRAENVSGATYTFQGAVTGSQEVSLWWTWWSSRCSGVPVDIYDGTTLLGTVQVDQQQQSLAGQWNVLGSYSFTGTARVVLRSQSGCSTDADAVQFKSTHENPAIIIDNRDSSVSSTGTWDVSGASNYYEIDSVWSRDGSTFTWHFTPSQSGNYGVSMWWTSYSSRSDDVPVNIQYQDGTTTIHVNQQQNGGQWNGLGQYYFAAGNTYDITITAQPSPASTSADAVKFTYITTDPFVMITKPLNYYLQPSSSLDVLASAGNLETGWGVKFLLDMGTANEKVISDYAAPYEAVFTGVTQAEHTLDAYVIDGSGNTVSGPFTHDEKAQIGIGQYYVAIGDSITQGIGDDDPSDDISLDGRNTGGGYEPILNDLLTAALGIPHSIVNEGVGGTTSADGLASINTIIADHPLSQRFLIEYGTNDARPWLPVPSGLGLSPGDSGYAGSFKDNMQQIIDAINAASKEACLAKAPITLGDSVNSTPYPDPDSGARSVLVKEYNQVIDELASDPSNNIMVVPPDFYSLFNEDVTGGKRYDFEYSDNLHPNGEGCRSMASEWENSLVP